MQNLNTTDSMKWIKKNPQFQKSPTKSIQLARAFTIPGHKSKTVKAGHLIIENTANGNCLPMPLTKDNSEYGEMPLGHQYKGFLMSDVNEENKVVEVMTEGTLWRHTLPYSINSFQNEVRSIFPNIIFRF